METLGEKGLVGRRIYYVSGFDPRGASYYHGHFSQQLKRFAELTGRGLSVGSRRKDSQSQVSRWQVKEVGAGGVACDVDYCFLHWDDIVRRSWDRNPFRLLGAGLMMTPYYFGRGALWRIARMSYPVALSGLAPVNFTLAAFLVAILAAFSVGSLAGAMELVAPLPSVLAVAIGVGVMVMAWQLAEQLGVVWMFRGIQFTRQLGLADDGEIRRRLQNLAEAILCRERDQPAREILLVGHSFGSFIVVMLAAELRRLPGFGAINSRISLLTMAQSVPFLAEQPTAKSFHRDLEELTREPRLPWRDVSSHDDFLCFPGVDPYACCGLESPQPAYPVSELIPLAQRHGFTSLWQVIKGQLRLHFEYLATAGPELSEGFDYLELVLQPLAEPALVQPPVP